MTDPLRWSDPKSGVDAETRALLSSDGGTVPSRDEANRIWAGLESNLPLAPGPTLGPQAAAPAAGTGALAGKITLAVVLVSAAGVGLYRWYSQDGQVGKDAVEMTTPSENPSRSGTGTVGQVAVVAPTKRVGRVAKAAGMRALPGFPATAEAASTGRASRPRRAGAVRANSAEHPLDKPVSATVDARRAPEGQAEADFLASSWGPSPWPAPTPATSGATRPLVEIPGPPEETPVPVNVLLKESRQLERARAALRAHDPDRALALLKVGAFPTTTLAQEREALTIEAMAAKPTLRAKATARAKTFLAAYPQSPYRARIRAIASAGE